MASGDLAAARRRGNVALGLNIAAVILFVALLILIVVYVGIVLSVK